MTAPDRHSAHLCLPQHRLSGRPGARLHKSSEGAANFAVIYFSDDASLSLHVYDLDQARALAAAFAKAVELLEEDRAVRMGECGHEVPAAAWAAGYRTCPSCISQPADAAGAQ